MRARVPPAWLMREPVIGQNLLNLTLLGLQCGRIIGQRTRAKSQQHHNADKKAANLHEAAAAVGIIPKPLPSTSHLAAFPAVLWMPGLAGTRRLMYMLIPKVTN